MAANVCPECGGLGWVRRAVPTGHPQFGQVERCPACSTDARLEWLTTNCGLEGTELNWRLHDWRLGNWKDGSLIEQRKDARDAIEQAIQWRYGLLTFWGDFGAGKSFALRIIVNELRLKGLEVFYAPLAAVLDHLRSLYQFKRESSHFWQRLLDIPVLALDEVTRFYETPWAQERLWLLIDTRYRRFGSHLTVVATNEDPRVSLPPSEPVGYLYSRLREGRLVELRGDMRPATKRKEG